MNFYEKEHEKKTFQHISSICQNVSYCLLFHVFLQIFLLFVTDLIESLLSIFIFNVQQIRGKELTTHAESLDYLKSLGLPVSPRYHVVHAIEEAIAEIEQIGQNRS